MAQVKSHPVQDLPMPAYRGAQDTHHQNRHTLWGRCILGGCPCFKTTEFSGFEKGIANARGDISALQTRRSF